MSKHHEDVLVLLERLSRVINNDAGLSDIKPTQWEALRFFAQANRFSRTPSSLTAYLGVTKGTVSQTLNALERKGLVKKEKDAGDRRSVSIKLTDTGEALLKNNPLERLASALAHIDSHALEQLSDTLRSVLSTALNQRSGTPFGACNTCKYFKENTPEGAPHLCSLLQVPLSSEDSEFICREHSA